jgi:hypothetical protein
LASQSLRTRYVKTAMEVKDRIGKEAESIELDKRSREGSKRERK